jgi:MtN3 and saliva related transmembrane protein
MDFTTLLGLAAATLTTTSYLPQVIKAWTSRSARDLSLKMLAALWVGLGLWVAYGLVVADVVVVIANAASFVLVSLLGAFKLRWEREPPRQ